MWNPFDSKDFVFKQQPLDDSHDAFPAKGTFVILAANAIDKARRRSGDSFPRLKSITTNENEYSLDRSESMKQRALLR